MGARTKHWERSSGEGSGGSGRARAAKRRGLEKGDRGGALDGWRNRAPSGGRPQAVAGLVTAMVAGQSRGLFTRAMLDEMNARHAQEHANCTKADTVALLKRGAAAAAAVVRGLHDDQLATSGTVFTDAPPMTAEQLITAGLLGHIDTHLGSIRRTVGD